MKWLDRIFEKKNSKKQEKIDNLANLYAPVDMKGKQVGLLSKTFVLEQSERIQHSVAELEEARREYDLVTKYLTDIQIIEGISQEEKSKIKDIASNILTMKQSREASMKVQKKISDAQFVHFERMKEEIPTAIIHFKENEDYQNQLKRDLDILDGEKASWFHDKKHLEQELVWIKKMGILLLMMFATIMVVLGIVYLTVGKDLSTVLLVTVTATALGAFALFIRRQNDEHLIKHAVVNYNYAINLQNQVKFKYISVTNAVDYIKEFYHVKNSYDFSFQWEQYLESVKEAERLDKTNDDLSYFNGLLMRQLGSFRLYDRKIWETQAIALIEPKEMVELKHELVLRRQKLRARIETQFMELEHTKNEFVLIMKKNTLYDEELLNITKMLERILEGK